MLKKIINITNVGRYKSFSWRNDELSFKRNTFIYGKNTKGKSTLASILKSLSTQNPDLIIWRKTFGATAEQQVTLETTSWNVMFQEDNWNHEYKIKVFDNQYVYENIYSNETIDPTKQENIVNIILWEEWKRLEEEYNTAKRLCDKNTQLKRSLSLEYWKILWNSIYNFEDFRWIQPDSTLDHQIKKAQDEIDSYKNQILIKEVLENFLSQVHININRKNLEQTLEISDEVIQQHIQKNISWGWWDKVLKFLEIWTSSLLKWEDVNCVYCGQNINDKNTKTLIEAYKILFSEQYQTLNTYVKETLSTFKKNNLWRKIWNLEKQLSQLGISFEITQREEIENYVTKFLSELESKWNNLNYNINFQSLDSLENLLNEVDVQIESMFTKYKDPIDDITKNQKEQDLKKLLLTKERSSPVWVEKCDEYQSLQTSFDSKLKPEEERTFKATVKYAQRILSWYETSINWILEKLWADFRLCEFQVPENRRTELNLFGIKFWTHKVELHWVENNYHFKNTLSDSDKRLLAFAFFIVDIQKTQDLDNYIIVFDDPMSSLDIDRKKMTIESVRDCLVSEEDKNPSQIIILTHEDSFFHIVYNTYKSIPDSTFLKIDYNVWNSSSEIQICNVEEEFIKTKHFKDLEIFKRYVNWEISWCSLNDIRIWLEYIIKWKYYLNIPITTIQNWSILSRYINNYPENAQKINDIYPHLSHHDQTWFWIAEEDLEESEKKNLVSKYLALIQEI